MKSYEFGTVLIGANSSPDGSKLVLAGRQLLKIIDSNNLTEISTLHSRANSISDVKWHPTRDNLVATSSASGNIIFWNLDKMFSKYSPMSIDLKRTVNTIDFCRSNVNHLISATLDGKIKLIDIRKITVEMSFETKYETCIRQLQFDKFEGVYVACACDNGNIIIWDLRKTDTPVNDFGAHNGPIFSVDWHPIDRQLLASGGRDRTIKIWKINDKSSNCLEQLHCLSAVSKIKWRPHFKNQLSCCSLLLDFSVNVWDIRRAYVPYTCFNNHHDIVTDICWLNEGSSILSTSKDGLVIINNMETASFPDADKIPVALAMHPLKNQLIHCVSTLTRYIKTESSQVDNQCFSEFCLKNSTSFKPVLVSNSSYNSYTFDRLNSKGINIDMASAENSSVNIINDYESHSSTISKLVRARTEHNLLNNINNNSNINNNNNIHSNENNNNNDKKHINEKSSCNEMDYQFQSHQGFIQPLSNVFLIKHKHISTNPNCSPIDQMKEEFQGSCQGKFLLNFQCKPSNYLLNFAINEEVRKQQQSNYLTSILTDSSKFVNIYLSDEIDNEYVFMAKNYSFYGKNLNDILLHNIHVCKELHRVDLEFVWMLIKLLIVNWNDFSNNDSKNTELETKKITLDSESLTRSLNKLLPDYSKKIKNKLIVNNETILKETKELNNFKEKLYKEIEGVLQSLLPLRGLVENYSRIPLNIDEWILDLLVHLVETGDIQTSIIIWMVLKRFLKEPFNSLNILNRTVEEWVYLHLDILKRYSLWNERTVLIKNCSLESISSISQTSTSLHIECSFCKSPLLEYSSFCKKCHKYCSVCSICLLPVIGLNFGCNICGHGGHPKHLISWFRNNTTCPFISCQHLCSFMN